MVQRTVQKWAESDALKLFARIGMGVLSIVMPGLVAVSIWVGNTVLDMNTKLAVLTERVGDKRDLYTQGDAKRDFAFRDEQDRQRDRYIAENRTAINENRQRILDVIQRRAPL